MSFRLDRFSLPLLQRELNDLAARPRTFLTRTLYAVAILGLLGWEFGGQFSNTDIDSLRDLGQGRRVFDHLMMWQLSGVCFFMPILSSGAISGEKECGTLQLLLITRLSPYLILLEKLASRVCVMLSLLLLAIPVTSYAYSLGGIEPLQIVGSFTVLVSTACCIGAFTLICSAFCSHTAGSLIASVLFGLPILALTGRFVLPAISSNGNPRAWGITILTQFLCVLLCLRLTRTALVARACRPPQNLALEFLRLVDRFWNRINSRYARGVIVVNDRPTLPDQAPIAWRESQKKSLGSVRYLVRTLVLIEMPTLLVIVLNLDFQSTTSPGPVPNGLLCSVWIITCLLITARVSSMIAGERSRQTLEILLTTPITGREII
ncbi:MAG: ABC transporter permease, partial [Planctomycetaceae bacterium]